jgi:hypothetical protein
MSNLNVNAAGHGAKERQYVEEINLQKEAQEASRDRIKNLTNAIAALKLRQEQERKQEREKKCKAYNAIQGKVELLRKNFNVDLTQG